MPEKENMYANYLFTCMSDHVVAMSSMLMNPQYILNEVSLNRNTHETKLFIDWLKEVLWPVTSSRERNSAFPLAAVVQHLLI